MVLFTIQEIQEKKRNRLKKVLKVLFSLLKNLFGFCTVCCLEREETSHGGKQNGIHKVHCPCSKRRSHM